MDLKPALPSHSASYEYDEEMKQARDNIRLSKRMMHFLALTLVVNLILTYGLIFHSLLLGDRRRAAFIKPVYPELAVPVAANTARSTHLSFHDDLMVAGDIETNGQSTGES
jgi:hypothetical protein